MPAKLKGLQKQVQETANRQEHLENNLQCHITELEEEVRLNIENKQLKATLGALEEKVEERDSERVEIEATPALEKELKESRPEREKVDVTLRGQPTEMEGVGTDVAAIANAPPPSYPMCDRPNLARSWEQGKSDSNFNIEEDKARKEAAKLQRKYKERYKELMEERYMKEVKKMKERYKKEEEKLKEIYAKELEKLRRQFEERYNELKKEKEVIFQLFRQMNKRRKKPIRDFEINLKFRVPF